MKKCHNCGYELEDSARFCDECGAKQEEPKKICPSCGKELPGKAKFCSACGTSLSQVQPADQTTQPQKQNKPQEPFSLSYQTDDASISLSDPETLKIVIKGIPFNMKTVVTSDAESDFLIGETMVTQALWMAVTGKNPSKENDDLEFPVTDINKQDVTAFLIKLFKLTGLKFDLPDGIQWQYAYSGGVKSKCYKYPGSDDSNEVGWVNTKNLNPVATLFPNELGLYDMLGNANELLKSGEHLPNNALECYISCRVVINISDNKELPAGELDCIIETIKLTTEKSRQENSDFFEKKKKEQEKAAKIQSILDSADSRGIVWYSKNDHLEKYIDDLMGEDYVAYVNECQELKKKAEAQIKEYGADWEPFYEKYEGDSKGASQSWNESIKYTILFGDTLVVKGKGDMDDLFGERDLERNKNIDHEKVKTVIVCEGITGIGEQCFSKFDTLKYLILPEGLKYIGKEAFYSNCIPFAILPESLKKIGRRAFVESSFMNKIFIPIGLESIEGKCFEIYEKFKGIILLPKSTKIELDSFYYY